MNEIRIELEVMDGKLEGVVLDVATGAEQCRSSHPFHKHIDAPELQKHLEAWYVNGGRRAWLSLKSPELISLPWEAWAGPVTLLRGEPVTTFWRPAGPLKLLIAWSDPATHGFPKIEHLPRELEAVKNELGHRGGVEVKEARATVAFLRDVIKEFRPDILHFIGHGHEARSGGVLVLDSGREGQTENLYASDLAGWLAEARTGFVFLSACRTLSFAHTIVESSGPTVIAMGDEVPDASAYLFTQAVYRKLSQEKDVVIAFEDGRKAIGGRGEDSGIPALLVGSATERYAPRHNLTEESRAFVGRQSALGTIAKYLHKGERMVTIHGMGGMGKSRLAKQTGLEQAANYRDGVYLVECDTLANGDELLAAIALALAFEPGSDPDSLAREIGDRHLLLIIDCFERLIDLVPILERILQKTPRLQMLITSRVLLGSEWEKPYELNPLQVGKKADESEGLLLFKDAVLRADAAFVFDGKTEPMAREVVRMVQGIPLAILLAAARLRHIPLIDLRDRLKKATLDVLDSKKKDRHASMRIVLGDSYALLTQGEQELALKLSVFEGGFTLEDVRAVLGEGLEDGIFLLCDHSMLTRRDARFRALDTIREFLGELSERIDLTPVRIAHAKTFASRAAEIRGLYEKGETATATALLMTDLGNFRAAVRNSIADDDAPIVAALSHSLARSFLEGGIHADFDTMATVAEQYALAHEDPRLLIEILGLRGIRARRDKRIDEAHAHWVRRAALCHENGDLEGEADSYLDIADLAVQNGRLEIAQEFLDRFDGIPEKRKNLPLILSGLLVKARLAVAQGNLQVAAGLAAEAAERIERQPVNRLTFYVWMSLAKVLRDCGDREGSARFARRMGMGAIEANMPHLVIRALEELSDTLSPHSPEQADLFESALRRVRLHTRTGAAAAQRKTKSAPWFELAKTLFQAGF